MFDLAAEGVTRLRRTAPFAETPIAWESLAGLVDGKNTRFQVRRGPIKSGTTTVYVESESVSHSVTLPDVVILASAPIAQPYASYTRQPMTNRQARQLLMDGVTECEMRWPRGLRLSSSSSAYSAATEDSSNIYVIAKSAVSDPSDDVALSESEAQKSFVVACALYVYRLSDLLRASLSAVSIRGTGGGMSLDRRGVADALLRYMAEQDRRLRRRMIMVQSEWTGGDSLGGLIDPVVTRDYMEQFEWQSASILEQWHVVYRYTPSDVDLASIT